MATANAERSAQPAAVDMLGMVDHLAFQRPGASLHEMLPTPPTTNYVWRTTDADDKPPPRMSVKRARTLERLTAEPTSRAVVANAPKRDGS